MLSIQTVKSNFCESFPPSELAIQGMESLYKVLSCEKAISLYKLVGHHALNLVKFALSILYWIGAISYAISSILIEQSDQAVTEWVEKHEYPVPTYQSIPQYEENYLMDKSYSQVDDFVDLEVMMPNLDNLLDSEPEPTTADVELLINQVSETTLKAFDAEYQTGDDSEWKKYLQSCKVTELRKLAQSKGISIRKNGQVLRKDELINLLS